MLAIVFRSSGGRVSKVCELERCSVTVMIGKLGKSGREGAGKQGKVGMEYTKMGKPVVQFLQPFANPVSVPGAKCTRLYGIVW